jgi:CRP-like cAMP-binding protein
MLMELTILPLNVIRLVQIMRLIKQTEMATAEPLSLEWLLPFAQEKRFSAGTILFRAGDKADHLLFILSGRFRLVEAGIELAGNEIVGELGFLSPNNLRTLTLECIEDGRASRVSYDDLKQLYFQNPQFGFAFLRLISERLFQNIERAKTGNLATAQVAGLAATGTSVPPLGT